MHISQSNFIFKRASRCLATGACARVALPRQAVGIPPAAAQGGAELAQAAQRCPFGLCVGVYHQRLFHAWTLLAGVDKKM